MPYISCGQRKTASREHVSSSPYGNLTASLYTEIAEQWTGLANAEDSNTRCPGRGSASRRRRRDEGETEETRNRTQVITHAHIATFFFLASRATQAEAPLPHRHSMNRSDIPRFLRAFWTRTLPTSHAHCSHSFPSIPALALPPAIAASHSAPNAATPGSLRVLPK